MIAVSAYLKTLKSKIPLSQKVAERVVREAPRGRGAGESSSVATMSPILREVKRETSQMASSISSAWIVPAKAVPAKAVPAKAVSAKAVSAKAVSAKVVPALISAGTVPDHVSSGVSAPVRKEHITSLPLRR